MGGFKEIKGACLTSGDLGGGGGEEEVLELSVVEKAKVVSCPYQFPGCVFTQSRQIDVAFYFLFFFFFFTFFL